ncbi:putative disease resistance protein RGA4 [Trifolium pratense]|uniref:Uncharacterized protein n=1 Tax=Trifolium pratense TaxID=57577 RepID=A0ACB0JUG2_TRIPR|nr:putative disease resistance protein RGA4 [Trifolium pratense]CAJ2647967.1 unnamed protein product [Trifolium pratense]
MAEAVVEFVLKNLTSLIANKLGLFLGFDKDFTSIASLLTTIKATLEDAEEKQFSNIAIKDWLQKLKDAAHVLDDILDECATEAFEYKRVNCGQSENVQTSFLSSFHPKHVAFRYKIAKKMKKIRERLDEISEEKSKFHLVETDRKRRNGVIDWRETTSIVTQPQVYGRDGDKDKIVDFLVSDASELEDLSVYPLTGIGGLGKTTLAQLIFNHKRIVDHFELRIWVCVSEDFSLKRMTKAMIGSISGNSYDCEDLDLEPLQRRLQELLRGKRYLLVLDDLWDEEQENWQKLKSVLSCGRKGASILVTTRLSKVAEIMGTVPPHELSMMSDEDCWELFKNRAFGPTEVESTKLVEIGKEILKKCRGVPLAAITLGSLLRFKREEKEWLHVKESKLWTLQGENSVMQALRLSYLYLPVKLRQCFTFCAIFPKDEEISKKLIIELWVANGFISSNEMLEAEDIGDEVWNELYWSSLFQDIQTDKFGKVMYFKMHDLVHDLAQSFGEETCCSTYNKGIVNMHARTRHFSIYEQHTSDENNSIQLHHANSLKTYIELKSSDTKQLSPQVLKCYSLRVLSSKRLKNLSTLIGRLKYLRYLDISHGSFKTLPQSLCRLCNLQVLKLDYCYHLKSLPDSLTCLKALQQLSLRYCYSLSSLPPHIGKLTFLRTLGIYVVGKKIGYLLEELGQLNLKGELHIKHLERVKSVAQAKEANMSSKHLNQLRLSWGRNEGSQLQENVEKILEVLQPHTQQLDFLGVGGYTGTYFPQWMSSPSLKGLTSLQLADCKSCLHLPQLGKLASLKNLKISNMSHVIYLRDESYNGGVGGLMALEALVLENLPNLIRLSREDGENMFPALSLLQITECSNLSGFPCLPSLKELYIEGKYNQHLLTSIHKLGSLETLRFLKNEELTCFPDEILVNLGSLKTLGFHHHSKLEILPNEIINLHALQILYIGNCDSIESLTDEVLKGLCSLKVLHIVKCHKLNLSEGFQYLTCLEILTISSCPEVESLHEALQHMTSLQCIILSDLPKLESLPDWLGNLSLLQTLRISLCPNLSCLPASIQCLSSLKLLCIECCPRVEKRCQKEIGEDWSKIAHVQHIEVRSKKVVHGDRYYGAGEVFLGHCSL